MRRPILLLAAVAASLSLCAPAQAAPVIVGSPLTASFSPAEWNTPASATFANVALAQPGAQVRSPVTGAIIAWHLDAEGGPFALRVLHPDAPGSLASVTATATSAPETTTGLGLQTFPTALPIATGDLIGLDVPDVAVRFGVAPEGGEFDGWKPALVEGIATVPTQAGFPGQIAFNAVVQPAPTITALGTTAGPTAGGTSVAITGTDLEGASTVVFGSTPATRFTVDSESQITAVAPAGAAGAVRLSVTTVAGTATSAQSFTFVPPAASSSPPPSSSPATKLTSPPPVRCHVPKLKGRKLKASKKALRKAHCKLGKVRKRRGAQARTGRVVKQSRNPRTVLPARSKVTVTLRP